MLDQFDFIPTESQLEILSQTPERLMAKATYLHVYGPNDSPMENSEIKANFLPIMRTLRPHLLNQTASFEKDCLLGVASDFDRWEYLIRPGKGQIGLHAYTEDGWWQIYDKLCDYYNTDIDQYLDILEEIYPRRKPAEININEPAVIVDPIENTQNCFADKEKIEQLTLIEELKLEVIEFRTETFDQIKIIEDQKHQIEDRDAQISVLQDQLASAKSNTKDGYISHLINCREDEFHREIGRILSERIKVKN